jgi:diguanylate cyclase (GGDEF)-like protein
VFATYKNDTVKGPWSRLNADERAYAAARVVLQIVFVALYVLNVIGANDVLGRQLYLAGFGLQICDTVIFFALVLGVRTPVDRAMMIVLIPDMITAAVFTYLGRPADLYYPVVMMTPILYALVVPKRQAWFAGVLAAVAYATGLVFVGPQTSAAVTVYFLKAALVPVAAFLVAGSAEHRRVREEKAELCAGETDRLNDQLRRRVHELQAVSEITEIVHSSLDFDEVGAEVLEIVAQAINLTTCCLFVIDKTHSETLFSASKGTASDAPSLDTLASATEAREYLTCIPVCERDPLMVMFCTTDESLAALSHEDRLVLNAVASELVVAVENSELYKLTSRLAVTDELTGLANYRQLQQRLDEELVRAARYGKHVSLLMLDADDFKSFNDAQGHVAGDEVLAEIGSIIRGRVREVDVVARYGGEEYSVVLPETDASGAFVVAEKIREAIELHQFADANGVRACNLTVSVGIAAYPTHARDKDSLLREADDALYHAKNGGKNRVRAPQRTHSAEKDELRPDVAAASDEWTGV